MDTISAPTETISGIYELQHLMAYPDASIYQFDANGTSQVAYEETEHYQVMRSFLMNPERMLRNLLRSE